ncbi:response regulator [Actinoplanes sp. G11-F43]|uniref:response regulator n=1 Tax=Actinoplanes sp. G11-F43 TaxID=3424130 RepID=UPI003D33EDB4
MADPTVRVLIADDDPLVRVGLSLVLGADPAIQVVGEAGDGAQAVAMARELKPDVVLMDVRMPRMDGLAATEELRRAGPAPAIIVLTTFDTDANLLGALRLGANGFLLKDIAPIEILSAVRRAAAGESILAPAVLPRLIEFAIGRDEPAEPAPRTRALAVLGRLSERERQVADAVATGASNARIGADLHMSVPTVKAYVSRVLDKLECANRVQVAVLVHEAGHRDT